MAQYDRMAVLNAIYDTGYRPGLLQRRPRNHHSHRRSLRPRGCPLR